MKANPVTTSVAPRIPFKYRTPTYVRIEQQSFPILLVSLQIDKEPIWAGDRMSAAIPQFFEHRSSATANETRQYETHPCSSRNGDCGRRR